MATVRAVRTSDLVIVARVRAGRYRLDVPPGRYWLFAATTRLEGWTGVDHEVGEVVIGAGQRKRVPVTIRARRAAARAPRVPAFPAPPTARTAVTSGQVPAVWVRGVSVGGSAAHYGLMKGMADMLITDLVPMLGPACGGVVVERVHRDWLLAHRRRLPGQGASGAGRPGSGGYLARNREVGGSLSVNGDTASLSVEIKDTATRRIRIVQRSGAADRPFELERSVVGEVARMLCGDRPPVAYAG